jgi:ATP-dependent exoDNAse (exonuclease V) alpha subunit
MAMFHLSVKYVSRRKGQAVVAAAAYRSGERLNDRYYGLTHDFTNKGGIAYTTILLPPDAPRNYADRETLWNSVEYTEKRIDSRLAREVEIALPIELSLPEQIQLLERYVSNNFVCRGMIADVAVHDKGNGNPHAHILLTTREVGEEGFSKKNREWDKRENVNRWRRELANELNRELERRGYEKVSHESHIARNTDYEPTIHLGYRVSEYERNGIETDRGNENRAVIERNRMRDEHKRQREHEREHLRTRSRER